MAGPGTDGTKAGAARRRHSKRLLPRWRARCARRRCNHSAGEPNHRALRTPSSACPVHAGLASAGDETLQGIWRGLAVRVLRDAIRGVDLKPGDSDMAIKEMRVHGARFSESRGIARLLVGV